MAVWPGYAKVRADGYVVREGATARRTPFDDGAVRQERAFTAAMTTRRVVALLDDDDARISFRNWAAANAHVWFSWADPDDGTLRRVRVVGGAGGIEYRAAVRRGSRRRRWEAHLALEGLWSDTV